MHNYLGVYVNARLSGMGRPQAHDFAATNVAHNHGIFNGKDVEFGHVQQSVSY